MSFINEFLKGCNDCKKGISHQSGNTEAYDRGYSAEYERAAIQDEITGGSREHNRTTHKAA